MNLQYDKKLKEEIDHHILKMVFITKLSRNDWLFPIGLQVHLRKNGKLRVCVDYKKLMTK